LGLSDSIYQLRDNIKKRGFALQSPESDHTKQFAPAYIDCTALIIALYDRCKKNLLARGILQWGDWDNGYPGEDFVAKTISRKELYALRTENRIIGVVALNNDQSPEWDSISWSATSDRCLVIHALAVDPSFEGKGFGYEILSMCEKHALARGYASIRLDSFAKNPASNRLYAKSGYAIAGSVFFDSKPEENREYFCYEKILAR
jgi:RimJ/RimL family protein N-acetyltransferase